jgi:hypothetical protein
MLDTGPEPSFDTLADDADHEAADDAEDPFEAFPEEDPAEVAAAVERDEPAATPTETARVDTARNGTATGRADTDTTAGDGVEGVPAGLFEDLAAAVEDPADDGQGDTPATETGDEGDVDVFEWVETASSPMTDGDESADASARTGNSFESLADRAAPAPADVLEDSGDGPTEVLADAGDESAGTKADSDVPIGAWEYDPERGLHVVTDEEPAEDGETEAARDTADTSRRDTATTDSTTGRGGPDLEGGSASGPADPAPTAADRDATASTREESTRQRVEPDPESSTLSEGTETEPATERDPDETVEETTVLEGADLSADDHGGEADDGPFLAEFGSDPDGHGNEARRGDGRSDTDTLETDLGTVVGSTAGERDESTAEPETAGPGALEDVGDGPETRSVIGRVRSFIGRLLP